MAYLRHTVNGIRDYSHRHVWRELKGEIPDGYEVDHINNNKQDNRIENLQCISLKENRQRQHKSTGYRIDTRKKLRPYHAQRTYNSKVNYLGLFGTPCGAKMAYNTFFIGGNS